jgi:hypothetical protein
MLQSHPKKAENKMMVGPARWLLLLFISFFLIPGILSSQEQVESIADENLEVFAPFVSSIRTSIRDPEIKVTWQDNPELSGPYLIYRYTSEINNENLSLAELVSTVDKGVQEYIDTAPENGRYYYAIIGKDTNGNAYEILVPFRNKTIIPIRIVSYSLETETPVIVETPEQTPEVEPIDTSETTKLANSNESGLTAEAFPGYIEINYTREEDGPFTLYRSLDKPENLESLSSAVSFELSDSSQFPFNDFVLPGQSYFYVVLSQNEQDNAELTLEDNLQRTPTAITALKGNRITRINRGSARQVQDQNLPLLFLSASSLSASIPESTESISSDTGTAIRNLLRPFPVSESRNLNPEVITLDKPQNQSQYATLQSVVTTDFQNNDWENTVSKLSDFRTLALVPEIDFLSRFYIAQALYFNGEVEASYLEFILIQDINPNVIDPWVDQSLSSISN